MSGRIGFPGWLKIVLPLVLAVLFGLSPRPLEFEKALKNTGDRSEADSMSAIIAYEPWRVDAVVSLAKLRLENGESQPAIELLLKAEAGGNLPLEGLRLLAAALEKNGQTGRALEIWQKIVAQDPDERDNYMKVHQLQAKLGQNEAGVKTLESMLEHFPTDAEGLYLTGLMYFSAGKKEGLDSLKQAAEFEPAYEKAVEILLAADYEASQSEDPAYQNLMRGRGLGSVGSWQLAADMFEHVVELNPDYAEGWAFLGEARQQTGAGDGQAELRKAAELDGNSQTVRGLNALYYRRNGEYDKALGFISQAARTEPLLASWQIEWANTLTEKNDLEEALIHYKKAIELEPNNPDNRYLLARFCLDYHMELRETGLQAAREGAARQPGDARWPDLLGRIFWVLGDADLAERNFRRSVEIDPDYSAASLHLGQLYLDQGDNTRAYTLIKSAAVQDVDAGTRGIAARLLQQYFNENVESD
jgi:tetratricopeptide (TPR) repeat protein